MKATCRSLLIRVPTLSLPVPPCPSCSGGEQGLGGCGRGGGGEAGGADGAGGGGRRTAQPAATDRVCGSSRDVAGVNRPCMGTSILCGRSGSRGLPYHLDIDPCTFPVFLGKTAPSVNLGIEGIEGQVIFEEPQAAMARQAGDPASGAVTGRISLHLPRRRPSCARFASTGPCASPCAACAPPCGPGALARCTPPSCARWPPMRWI